MGTRWQDTDAPRGDSYDQRWTQLAESGGSIHGEADFVDGLLGQPGGRRILDAGCGTGRVAIELARRGHSVIGVDADLDMLDTARTKAPDLSWIHADLADLGAHSTETFDLVLLAGNVMIYLAPGTEERVMAELADRLAPGGLLVAGFSIRPGRLPLAEYDHVAAGAGLESVDRFATWDREPYDGGDYAVSVHRRAGAAGPTT
ncbi:SAM-dependent methyltransferase [Mycobacterium sp. Root135]|uniref:class I SAM-dependent DNA methyltransferase n=1 Tax=Mycobacterium sp. Root135 TaxID=1736457 RepID=UPI0006F87DFB|nr:class I SAM-dependent methyltransferase [Mycobacterium sp. Root135]KQY09157.1 SAM-dependent methyltransferase [Mycobacterium sp. Root135]